MRYTGTWAMENCRFLLLTGWLLMVNNAYSSVCVPGWMLYESNCYKVVHKKISWHDAEEVCNQQHTGHLAAIYTTQHQAFIKCLISNSTDTFWIGLKRKQNGKLLWSTGLKYTLDNRISLNRRHNDSDKCYAMMYKDQGTWRGVNCSHHHNFICQYSSLASYGLGRNLWQNIIGKVLSSLDIVGAWLLLDKPNPTPSACREYFVKSLQVTGNRNSSNTPSKQSSHQGDQRARKQVQLSKKEDKYFGSTEIIPQWHYNPRTKRPKANLAKAASSSTETFISSPISGITSTIISPKGSKATLSTKTAQATKLVSLLTTDKGRVFSGSGLKKTTPSEVSSMLILITPNYTKTTTNLQSNVKNRDSSPSMMLTSTPRELMRYFLTSISPQNVTVDFLPPSTTSSHITKFSLKIQKRKNENHYNITPIITAASKDVKNKSTVIEQSTVNTQVKRKLPTDISHVDKSTETMATSVPGKRTATIIDAGTKISSNSVTIPSHSPSTSLGVEYVSSLDLLTTISTNLTKPTTPSSPNTIFSPVNLKHQKGKRRYNLTPIISYISPNSTPWSKHLQSPILTKFNHMFSKLNNSSYKLNGNMSRRIHTIIHNRSRSDAIIASIKKKLSGKNLQEHVKELIKKTLGRHIKYSTMNSLKSVGNGLPPIDSENGKFNPRLTNFGDFFKIVDYFVNICHEAEWKKNELEGIVKEIAENTDPFLKSSLSGRTFGRYTKTLDYVDIEVMHVGVSHVGNVNCHGKNGKWKVSKLKLLSKTKINETISISMILLNTPAISINSTNKNGDGSAFLVSPLLSIVAFGNQQILQVSHTFSLKINRNITSNTNTNETEDEKEEYDFSCVFLDIATGFWSDFGCKVTEEAISQISCFCNHTTNFAILMQVRDFKISKQEELTLSTISYIGCSISLITQFITIAVFTFIEILRCERTFVHRNLCLAIVGAQITFLAGIKAVKHKIACSMIALVLHYCYMSVFAWMLVEGLHLYSRVVRVFGSELYRKIYYSIFGWGMPVLLVVISAAADWDGYGTEKVCWLSISEDTIWAFVGPAVAIITVNIVILVCVTRIVMTSAKHGKQGQFDQVRAGVKGALFLIPILGMTWVFGLLSVNRNLIIFQYMFAVSNSLQGFFIFLFHVVLNSEVRQALTRLRERRSLQKGDLSSTSSTSGNTSWNTRNIQEKAARRWSRRVSPAQTGTSGTTSTV